MVCLVWAECSQHEWPYRISRLPIIRRGMATAQPYVARLLSAYPQKWTCMFAGSQVCGVGLPGNRQSQGCESRAAGEDWPSQTPRSVFAPDDTIPMFAHLGLLPGATRLAESLIPDLRVVCIFCDECPCGVSPRFLQSPHSLFVLGRTSCYEFVRRHF